MDEDWLLIADRNFYNWKDWCTAADTGATLLWRVASDLLLAVLELLPDGSYRSVLVNPKVTGKRREALIEDARRGDDLDQDKGRYVRVVEYEVPDRDGDGKDELIALVTTITDFRQATAAVLAQACHERWEHEGANQQLKIYLRGLGKVLRSGSPPLVEREIWGYLLTLYAISAPTCAAATAAGIDPDRVKFKRTVRILRRRVADPAFSPEHAWAILARVKADITKNKHLNPRRRHRNCPRVIKRGRHNAYRVKKPADKNVRHDGPQRSASPTPSRPTPQHDQNKLNGIDS